MRLFALLPDARMVEFNGMTQAQVSDMYDGKCEFIDEESYLKRCEELAAALPKKEVAPARTLADEIAALAKDELRKIKNALAKV